LPKRENERNAFLILFSGLVSVADWLGSMADHFPFCEKYLSPYEYARRAENQAKNALEKLGWLGWQTDGSLPTFAATFPAIPAPNEIQKEAFEASLEQNLPALIILEAPTGIGKTEAAFFIADTWLQRMRGRGLYVAMPTQATSNQMYGRMIDFLKCRYPAHQLNAHLAHANALLEEDLENSPELQDVSREEQSEGTIKAETWFLPRKRTLLAPFAVGTVDQALMSVLQTHHFFVRLFGLGQKVVIFDEVHAYDTYMSTLFQRLLSWLRAIGTSVVLLSATLPEKTCRDLIGAWCGKTDVFLTPANYPRLTIASVNQIESRPLTAPPSCSVRLEWVEPTPDQIAVHLNEKLKDGGCAAVICNRVQRAQEIFATIRKTRIVEPDDLILFHARFPYHWRKNIEDQVLALFGKHGKRPHKAIVVATQVIEQSLDLDFDYLLTDLAPLDLLIQRAGRMHRHRMNDSRRPKALKDPCLALTRPAKKGGLPDFGLDTWVYDKSTLLRTWKVMLNRKALSLPEETPNLIEAVYGDGLKDEELEPDFRQAQREADEDERKRRNKSVYKAKERLVAPPDDEGLLSDPNEGLEEEDPTIHEAFRALTRLAEPSVSLICLHETDRGIALEPDGEGAPVDVSKRPDRKLARELLKRAINIQRRDIVDYFIKSGRTTKEWKRSAAVRYHFPIVFDGNGLCRLKDARFTLKLTRELGLEVIKEEK
jgi:CRISPR-associated endonuclease/helicase Cas3